MFCEQPQVVRAAGLPDHELDLTPLDSSQIVAGEPEVRHLAVATSGDSAVGIWQHSPGVSTDVEVDEMFVVLRGRATIDFADGTSLDIGPGDLVGYPRGSRTRWTVHETLRKVYVIHG